jgi:ribonuclease BN (tRNA processing enzyme)
LAGPLTLQSSGHLSLFPLGTGSAFAKTLYQNNLLVIKGDNHLLIDCGTRTPEAFHRLGLPITEVRNFLITHSHADHIGGLEEVILMGRYMTKRKPAIYITPAYQDQLWAQSMRGGAAWNERRGQKWLTFADYWDIQRPEPVAGLDREAHCFMVGDLRVTTLRTMHYPDNALSWEDSAYSVAVIIDERLFYTADTRFDRALVDLVCQRFPIEAIFHDVQFFPGGVHAGFDDLQTLPAEIKAKTWLMHYPDTWANHLQKVKDGGFQGFLQPQHFYDFLDSKAGKS